MTDFELLPLCGDDERQEPDLLAREFIAAAIERDFAVSVPTPAATYEPAPSARNIRHFYTKPSHNCRRIGSKTDEYFEFHNHCNIVTRNQKHFEISSFQYLDWRGSFHA